MYYKINKKQQGLSLIELVISLAIGMILLIALSWLMIAANNSAKQRSTSELLDEQARQIFSYLEKDLYRAGFVDSFMNEDTLMQAFNVNNTETVAGYTRQVANISDSKLVSLLGRNTNGSIIPLEGFDNINMPPAGSGMTCTETRQCLQVAYQALGNAAAGAGGFSSVANEAGENASLSGAAVGCSGVQASNTHPIIIDQYEVDIVRGENNSSLRCATSTRDFANNEGATNGTQPIVAGVEQLVFRYLVTPPDNTAADEIPDLNTTISGRSVNGYLTAGEVMNTQLQWAGVVGVEVCTVVAAEPMDGGREADIPAVQPNVPSCLRDNTWDDGITRPIGDMRLYRRYVRTIILPNTQHLMN